LGLPGSHTIVLTVFARFVWAHRCVTRRTCRTLNEVCAITNAPKKEIGRCYKFMLRVSSVAAECRDLFYCERAHNCHTEQRSNLIADRTVVSTRHVRCNAHQTETGRVAHCAPFVLHHCKQAHSRGRPDGAPDWSPASQRLPTHSSATSGGSVRALL
jgi:hypothetical protein